MAVTSALFAEGVKIDDIEDLNVKSSTAEFNSSQTFSAHLKNTDGRNKTKFSIGNEIVIYADDTDNVHTYEFPYTFNFRLLNPIFRGTIEDIKFDGRNEDDVLNISGRDYTARLMDSTVQPEVWTNTEISVIVKDIIASYTSGLTTTNVSATTVTLQRVGFNHTPVFDALKQLADLAGYFFYVDVDKDVHFELKGSLASNITLNNSNIVKPSLKASDKQIANKVWVYGGRVLAGAQDVYDSTTTEKVNGGSVFTLTYKPKNTNVFVNGGSVPKIGGVFEFASTTLGSPLDYLVNFDDRKIVFVSGTFPGNNIPPSGTASEVIVDYQRTVPIVKFGQDNASVAAFGAHSKVIVDKNIKEPSIAEKYVLDELDRNSNPWKQISIEVRGLLHFTAGKTVVVDIPNFDINSITYDILEVQYDFNTNDNLKEQNVKLKLSKKIKDVTDTIKQLILDVKKLQADDIDSGDLLTRLESATGSFGIHVYSWYLTSRNVGAAFILGHAVNGVLGSPASSVSGVNVVLGDSRVAGSTLHYSGGFFT